MLLRAGLGLHVLDVVIGLDSGVYDSEEEDNKEWYQDEQSHLVHCLVFHPLRTDILVAVCSLFHHKTFFLSLLFIAGR